MIDPTENARLQAEMAAAESSEAWSAYVAAESELENLYAEAGMQAGRAAQHQAAAAAYREVVRLNRALLATLPTPPTGDAKRDKWLLRNRDAASNLTLAYAGRASWSDGLHHISTRNPGLATGEFGEAADNFSKLAESDRSGLGAVMAKYAAAMTLYAAGLEDLYRLNYSDAAASFQRSRLKAELTLQDAMKMSSKQPGDSELASLIPYIQSDVGGMTVWYMTASVYDRIAHNDLEGAVRFGKQLADLSRQVATETPADAPDWIRYSNEAHANIREGNYETLRGQRLMQQRSWDEANTAFETARTAMQNAAESFLRSEMPGAVASQETVLNQATAIDVLQRQLENLRKLAAESRRNEDELAWLRQTVTDAVKKGNVTVTSITDVVTNVRQNTEIVVQLEQRFRGGYDDLGHALQDAQKTAAIRKENPQLLEQVGGLVDSVAKAEEQGASFIEKATNLTKDLAGIVAKAGPVAAALWPFVRPLAALAGVPVPF